MASSVFSYTIGGVRVQFPCKPYPSQMSMMDKIMKGVERQQNCLLESPTGSGKSLALLCSVLAWQQAEKEKLSIQEEKEKEDCEKSTPYIDEDGNCYNCGGSTRTNAGLNSANQIPPVPTRRDSISSSVHQADHELLEEDDDFKPPDKKLQSRMKSKTRVPIKVGYEDEPATSSSSGGGWTMEMQANAHNVPLPSNNACTCSGGCCDELEGKAKKKKPPKIYFGTRTHKQIKQICRELQRTAYKYVNMTILASREHTCIDPEVSTMAKKNEECKNKLDGPGCRFNDNVRRISHGHMNTHDLREAWDLEDFVGYCKKYKACPYFGSRAIRETADIIFCPYNYLIDPVIRRSMEINLKDQIVILDEAHNIEDASREAASFSVTQKQLTDAVENLQHIVSMRYKPKEHALVSQLCSNIKDMIQRCEPQLEGGHFESPSKVWSGMEMLAMLQDAGMGPDTVAAHLENFMEIAKEEDDPVKKDQQIKASSATLSMLEGILLALEFIYKENQKYLQDYRLACVRSTIYEDLPTAFTDMGEVVRSIILTSGTLSPMSSFQSELGIPFPILLEASHVVGKSQVWVGTISRGPRGGQLLGSYQTSETFAYQDEVGNLVLQVCQTIPHGVLCFLSSYSMLNKLKTRWQDIGLWDHLTQHKRVLCEPRASERVDFDALLKRFYDAIRDSEETENNPGGQSGALFMAVCRGKVSEGLDFNNNNARAVITVGIPFPSIKDPQVDLKKKYNNMHANRGLLSGSAWYEIQAYRAINQALGRCIRHRYDWGALILVDERFAKNPNKYITGLSKWVRQNVQYYQNFSQAQHSLKDFTKKRMEIDRTNPADISMVPVDPDMTMPMGQLDGNVSTATTPFKAPYAARERTAGSGNQVSHTDPHIARSRRDRGGRVVSDNTEGSHTPLRNAFSALMPNSKSNAVKADLTKGSSTSRGNHSNHGRRTDVSGSASVNTPRAQRSVPVPQISPDPRFFSASQAGGFLPSQMNETDITDGEPTQNEPDVGFDETVLEGSLETSPNPSKLDETGMNLDFNPPMASTQAPGPRSSLSGSTENIPKPAILAGNGNEKRTLASKLSHFAFSKRSPAAAQTPKKSSDLKDVSLLGEDIHDDSPTKSKLDSKQTTVTPIYKCDNVNLDSREHATDRAQSPPLFFDSMDFEGDIVMSSQTKCRKPRHSQDSKPKAVLDFSDTPKQKPLFKPVKHEPQSGQQDESSSTQSVNRSRLSRKRRSDGNMNQTQFDASVQEGVTIATADAALLSGTLASAGATVVKGEVGNTSAKSDISSKDEEYFLGTADANCPEETLKTKRVGSSKRRQAASARMNASRKKTKGVEYNDEEEKLVNITCSSCSSIFITRDTGPREELFLPHFLQGHGSRMSCFVTDDKDIPQMSVMHATLKGAHLNSHWSEAEQCCVQYLQCGSCDSIILGAHILAVTKPGKYRPGQLWLVADRVNIR